MEIRSPGECSLAAARARRFRAAVIEHPAPVPGRQLIKLSATKTEAGWAARAPTGSGEQVLLVAFSFGGLRPKALKRRGEICERT